MSVVPLLQVDGLSNTFKKVKILQNITFSIEDGSFQAFLGENGSGKTTTMSFIAGILNDYTGEILFKGTSIREIEEKSILFIPERLEFPSHLTSFKFVKTFVEMFLNKKIDKDDIDKQFKDFDISEVKNRKVNKLSSGQKKKVSLIRAILSKPNLLLIDEPAANLDPTSRFKLFNKLKELNSEGTTILISSHIISELEKYTDSATIIKKGVVMWTGKVKIGDLSQKYQDIVIKGGGNG